MNPELYDPKTPYGRFRIAKRWAMQHGRRLENGALTISWEDEQAALADWAEQHPESFDEPPPRKTTMPTQKGEVVLVEPGKGSLKVAVLCPGPSLAQTWPKGERRDGYDLVIAVNNAAEHAPCDWWSAQDHGPLKTYAGEPSVGICTSGSNEESLMGDRPWLPKAISNDRLDELHVLASHKLVHEDAPRKGGWSTVNAIILAARLGAKTIDLYGDDKTGDTYFDGVVNRGSKPGRWERETKNQKDLTDALQRVGVSVRNIAPAQPTDAEG